MKNIFVIAGLMLCTLGTSVTKALEPDIGEFTIGWWLQHPADGKYLFFKTHLDDETSFPTRVFAAEQVAGPNASPDLVRRLGREREPWLRFRIAESLIVCGDQTAKDALASLLQSDKEPLVAGTALKGLISLADSRGIYLADQFLDGDDVSKQLFTLAYLPDIRGAEFESHAANLLGRAISASHEDLLTVLIPKLGKVGSSVSMHAILKSIEDERDSKTHWTALASAADEIQSGRGEAFQQELTDEDSRIAAMKAGNASAASSFAEYSANRDKLIASENQKRSDAYNAAVFAACSQWLKQNPSDFLHHFRKPFADAVVASRNGLFTLTNTESGNVAPPAATDTGQFVSDTKKWFVLLHVNHVQDQTGADWTYQFQINDDTGLFSYVTGSGKGGGSGTFVTDPTGMEELCQKVQTEIGPSAPGFKNPNANLQPVEIMFPASSVPAMLQVPERHRHIA